MNMPDRNKGKLPSKVLQNLERLYKLAIGQDQRFPFFKALHAYLEFALKEPTLKSIIEEQMAQRNDQYKKINEAEEQAVKEMRWSKDKILSIVKKKKIDTSDFDRPSTFPVWDTGGKNIVQELEAMENKEIEFYSSQSYSGRLQSYLFDISAGLLKRGYAKELGDLVVPEKEYGEYYQRINGTSGYFFAGNTNGNFIFSQNWPKTFEYKNLVERERVLKPWGAFEKAIQFMRAFHNVLTDTSTWKIQETISPYDYLLDGKDLVEVFHMTEDFYHISGQTRDDSSRRFQARNSPELEALHTPTFKNVIETIHSVFIQALEVEESESESKKISLFLNPSGELWREPKAKYCYEMGEESDRCKIVKFLSGGGYKQTQVIANELGDKNKQTLRTEKSKINTNIKNKLKLSNFIDGKKGSGYRINPKYKIILKRE